MTSRTKALLGSAATIVVIAVVILGLWAFGSGRKMTPPTVTLSPLERSNQALKGGLAALSKEQTGTATELFQSAITIDPGNTAAKAALAKVQSGGSSTSGGSNTTGRTGSTNTTKTPPVVPDSAWEKGLDIAALLPRTFPDYSLSGVDKSGADAQVSASPSRTGATVTSLVWAVHDRGSGAKAADFITKTSKAQYNQDAKTVNVNGVAAYFGTDGTRFATVTYVRGRYVFELVITTSDNPASHETFAQQAAAAFATTP